MGDGKRERKKKQEMTKRKGEIDRTSQGEGVRPNVLLQHFQATRKKVGGRGGNRLLRAQKFKRQKVITTSGTTTGKEKKVNMLKPGGGPSWQRPKSSLFSSRIRKEGGPTVGMVVIGKAHLSEGQYPTAAPRCKDTLDTAR